MPLHRTLRLATCLAAAWLLHAGTAHAGYMLGGASNFAVLYTGTAANQLSTTNTTITGNVGIGDPNGNLAYLSASGPGTITGAVEYAASTVNANNSVSNTTITGGVTANNPAVQTALNALSTMSTTLGGETGTAQNITAGNSTQTITATSGHLDGSGNYVFAVSTVNLTNGGVLTINGSGLTAGQDVVFNITASNPNFDGAISLVGLTDDQVLFNIVGSGSTLTISSNGQTLNGDFLDYSGSIQMNHSTLDGRLFGGDSSNMQIVSGATIVAPPALVPEPSSLAVLGVGVIAFGVLRHRKQTLSGTRTA